MPSPRTRSEAFKRANALVELYENFTATTTPQDLGFPTWSALQDVLFELAIELWMESDPDMILAIILTEYHNWKKISRNTWNDGYTGKGGS